MISQRCRPANLIHYQQRLKFWSPSSDELHLQIPRRPPVSANLSAGLQLRPSEYEIWSGASQTSENKVSLVWWRELNTNSLATTISPCLLSSSISFSLPRCSSPVGYTSKSKTLPSSKKSGKMSVSQKTPQRHNYGTFPRKKKERSVSRCR